jgi:hypothetical protein
MNHTLTIGLLSVLIISSSVRLAMQVRVGQTSRRDAVRREVFTLLSSEKAKRTKPSASQVACEMVSNLP